MKHIEARMIFGFLVLLVIAALAGVIALGKVHQDSSFGLQFLLGALTSMAGGFTNWAFSNKGDSNGGKESN